MSDLTAAERLTGVEDRLREIESNGSAPAQKLVEVAGELLTEAKALRGDLDANTRSIRRLDRSRSTIVIALCVAAVVILGAFIYVRWEAKAECGRRADSARTSVRLYDRLLPTLPMDQAAVLATNRENALRNSMLPC